MAAIIHEGGAGIAVGLLTVANGADSPVCPGRNVVDAGAERGGRVGRLNWSTRGGQARRLNDGYVLSGNLAGRLEMGKHLVGQRLGGLLCGVQNEFRLQWRLIRIVDPRKSPKLSSPRLFVESFRVSGLAHLDRCIDDAWGRWMRVGSSLAPRAM